VVSLHLQVSIIARQSLGGQLTTYYSKDLGEELLLLHFGIESHEVRVPSIYTSVM